VFNAVCSACHLQGFAGAPRLGDKAAWASRVDKGETILLEHALFGYRRMPAKGACRPCSAQDLADAIAYMVEHSR
jgi:cytochrome c5